MKEKKFDIMAHKESMYAPKGKFNVIAIDDFAPPPDWAYVHGTYETRANAQKMVELLQLNGVKAYVYDENGE
jgi:hypothetical protein